MAASPSAKTTPMSMSSISALAAAAPPTTKELPLVTAKPKGDNTKASTPVAPVAPSIASTVMASVGSARPVKAPSPSPSMSLEAAPALWASQPASASPTPKPPSREPVHTASSISASPLASSNTNKSIVSNSNAATAQDTTSFQTSVSGDDIEDHDLESELSEPDSTVNSPVLGLGSAGLVDEIVVSAHANQSTMSPTRRRDTDEDDVMEDAQLEETASPYPRRKRTSTYADLGESSIDGANGLGERTPLPANRARPNKPSLGVKHVIIGHWRDSNVPDVKRKHAVVGFIDVRDRLRTRIQPHDKDGLSLAVDWPMPPGPGGSWVTFDRVVFSEHLIGLEQVQIKEYVRFMSEVDEAQNQPEVIKKAVQHAKAKNAPLDGPPAQSAIAYGSAIPEHATGLSRAENKRRKTSGAFTPIGSSSNAQDPSPTPKPQESSARSSLDPLFGTRPTRIVVGYWKGSDEMNPLDRHAVWGILSASDMFRVKVVRETRDGRHVDGNFPTGAGALWIQWEDVEFEDHLKPLTRTEIKEYCRVRQYQIDNGELPDDRNANVGSAVRDAQNRAASLARGSTYPTNATSLPPIARAPTEPITPVELVNGRAGVNGQSFREPRRAPPRIESRPTRQPLNEVEARPHEGAPRSDARERTAALAQREIARVEAAQSRADRHAGHRERAAAASANSYAAAAEQAAAAASATPSLTNGAGANRSRFHETDELQRLNDVWARQENLRVRAGAEDAKIYDGIKYERKTTGPFMGKLVSQGTIINIDDEDYVEYRVLTKPSFF